MKLVYICSPYAGEIESNIRFAKDACLYAAEHSCAPVAVHLLYPQILDDAIPAQRELGIPIRGISAEQIQGGCRMKYNDPKERTVMPEETPSPGMMLEL